MTSAEEERFNQITARMAKRDCHCGHCEDLRFLLDLVRREIVVLEEEAASA